MDHNEIKAAVATAAAQNEEAFAEIGVLVADLNKQIVDLKADALNPAITDPVFLANMDKLLATGKKLQDIVPGTPGGTPTEPPAEPPVELTPAQLSTGRRAGPTATPTPSSVTPTPPAATPKPAANPAPAAKPTPPAGSR